MRPDPLTPGNLLALGGACGYPALQSRVGAGADAWRAILCGPIPLTPPERARLLAALGRRHLLVALTAGARARARRWIDQQRVRPTRALRPWAIRERVRQLLLYIGDPELLGAVVEAFALLPACVRDVLLDEVAVLGVGASSQGWTSSATFRDRDGRRRTGAIVLSGAGLTFDQLRNLTLHELAHGWTAPLPREDSQAMPALAEAALWRYAASDGWLARAEAWERRDELHAEALAIAWRTQL